MEASLLIHWLDDTEPFRPLTRTASNRKHRGRQQKSGNRDMNMCWRSPSRSADTVHYSTTYRDTASRTSRPACPQKCLKRPKLGRKCRKQKSTVSFIVVTIDAVFVIILTIFKQPNQYTLWVNVQQVEKICNPFSQPGAL